MSGLCFYFKYTLINTTNYLTIWKINIECIYTSRKI